MDTYLNLCTQVYDLSKPHPPKDAYAFYKSYVEQAQNAILEPMCGTGRFLIPLLKEGFKIDGFDASEHMLEALHQKAKKLNLACNVWKGLAENINQEKRYNLIFIPSGSFGLIIDPKSIDAILRGFYSALKKEGILVFEIETLKALPHQFGIWRSSLYRSDNKKIIASFFDLPPEDNIMTSLCRYELVHNNEIIKTEIEDFRVRMYHPADLMTKLKNIGFTKVNLFKAFARDLSPGQEDEVVVFECKK